MSTPDIMDSSQNSNDLLHSLNECLKTSVQIRSYSTVEALVFYWEEADREYKEEGEAVCQMFQDVFNFPVTKSAIPTSRSYLHVLSIVSKALARESDGSSLLVIHYGGHGDRDNDRDQGQERRSVWAACAEGGPTLEWYRIQDEIRNTETDVLLLLDCCYAALAGRARSHENARGRFEILAAAAKGEKTPPPGDMSFTKILIREVWEAIKSDGFVCIKDLHTVLSNRTRAVYGTPVHISLNPGRHALRLEPFSAGRRSMNVNDPTEQHILHAIVRIKEGLNPHTVVDIGQWLGAAVPPTVSGIEILDVAHHIQTTIQEIGKGNKEFFKQLNKPAISDITKAWEEVVRLVARYDAQEHNDIISSLDSTMAAKNQRTLKFLRDLDTKNGQVLEALERNILNAPNMDDRNTLDAACDDGTFQFLGLASQFRMRRIISFPDASMSMEKHNIAATQRRDLDEGNLHVIQETKRYGLYFETEFPAVRERVRLLASLLSLPKSSAFRSLTCIGWHHEEREDSFVLDFRIPGNLDGSQYHTLQTIIKKTRGPARPSLNSRLGIGLMLARAVQKWHTVGWVHQGIGSHNVIFFSTKSTGSSQPCQLDYASPFLHGFSFARPHQDPSIGRHDTDSIEFNVYRHPDRQGTSPKAYRKKHDMYSLGVVLLEIGLWQCAVDIVKRQESADPSHIRDLLLRSCTERLAHFAGDSYQRAVEVCLSSRYEVHLDDESGSNLAKAYQSKVIDELAKGVNLLE